MPVRELLMRIQLLMTRYSDLAAAEPQAGRRGPGAGPSRAGSRCSARPRCCRCAPRAGSPASSPPSPRTPRTRRPSWASAGGDIVSATVGSLRGAEAVYAFLAWTKGSFKFTPGDPGSGEPLAHSVEHLLLEGCRLLDESQDSPAPPARAKASAPGVRCSPPAISRERPFARCGSRASSASQQLARARRLRRARP